MPTQKFRIKLDKIRYLYFDFNACCELEKITGQSIFAFISNLPKDITEGADAGTLARRLRFGMRELRYLVWAGLLHEKPDLTVLEVGNIFDKTKIGGILGLGQIMALVLKALLDSAVFKSSDSTEKKTEMKPKPKMKIPSKHGKNTSKTDSGPPSDME